MIPFTRILREFNLELKEVSAPSHGYRNFSYPITTTNNQQLNFVLYKDEPEILDTIKNANRISDFLATRGFPTRVTLTTKQNESIIRVKSPTSTRFASIYNYLPGETIPWEGYTQKHLKLLGKAMSDMHFALKNEPQKNLINEIDLMRELTSSMQIYFSDPDVSKALARKLNLKLNNDVFALIDKLLPQLEAMPMQSLHMDFVRSNILFSESPELHISGILDFEKAAWGPTILDIARTLAFLLTDCHFKPAAKVRKYFLLSGYKKRGQNDLSNLELLNACLCFFWLYDLYKFLYHNPYEFLLQNMHFCLTRDKLLSLKILKDV